MKITDSRYTLPVIEALQLLDVLSTGTTAPLIIRGVNKKSGEKDDYVVKPMGATRMSPVAATKELLGSWMASEFDLACPHPVCLNVSEPFVEASIGRDGFRSLSASIGPNFATEQMIGARQVNSEHDVDTIESNYLATIFLFDILIDNPDRVNPAVANAGKPNLMIHKDQCVVIDHEIAFAYTDLISFLQNPSPWVLRAEDHEVVTKHLLYLRQMKDQIDFEELVDNLIVFNDDFWDAVNLHLPSFHDGDTVSTIENHTRQLVDHRFELGKSINEMLYT